LKEKKIAIAAAETAGDVIMKYYRSKYEITDKSPNNPVTEADLAANYHIQETITSAFPQDGWLSEESKDSPDRVGKERVWVIDPIDGTLEFIEGLSQFAVSIALVENNRPIVGVLNNPATKELFVAVEGEGAHLNGERLSCLPATKTEQATLLASRTEHQRGQLKHFENRVGELKYIGSVAYKLGRLAAGSAHGYLTVQPKNEWDICAGDLIVREAGGVFWNREGESIQYNQPDPKQRAGMFAGRTKLVEDLVNLYKEVPNINM